MPNPHFPRRPIFGNTMNQAAFENKQNNGEKRPNDTALSEEKARAFLEKSAQETSVNKENGVSPASINTDEAKAHTEDKQPIEDIRDGIAPEEKTGDATASIDKPHTAQNERASMPRHSFHFGEKMNSEPKTSFFSVSGEGQEEKKPLQKEKKEKIKQGRARFPKEKKEKEKTSEKRPHSFFRRIWNLLFSDTSFCREDCLIPKKSAGIDRIFLLSFVLLLCIGSVMVFSSSYAYAEARYDDSSYFVRRQLIFAALGIGVMLVASMMTVQFYRMISRFAFAVTLLLLAAVLVVGVNLNGAQRWLGFGPLTIQPTEIAKLTMVMMLAWYFSQYGHKLREKQSFIRHLSYNTLLPGMIIGVICGLVMLQKHLSGIIILGSIGLLLMFVAGTDARHLGTLMGVAVAAVTCIALFTDYTKRRIDIWLDPYSMRLDGGWQTIQGLNAIGTGGFLGLGIGDSRMKYSWVSEPANDFIFTIACEELGFVGAFIILALFAVFVWRGYVIAMRNPDTFARLLAFGIVTKVAVQTLLNIAVITNTIPNTGIPLPFFSYGGTSLVIQLMEMGIVLSVSRTSQLKYR